jgi:hypothetical protein
MIILQAEKGRRHHLISAKPGGTAACPASAGILEKGKLSERAGRKTRGLRRKRYGSPVAGVSFIFSYIERRMKTWQKL